MLLASPTKPLDESLRVDRSELIQRHEPGTTLKAAGHAPRICLTACRHRRDDGRAKVTIELVWRNDQARARFSNFASHRRIKVNQVDVASEHGCSPYHFQSSSSNFVGVGSSRSSWCARSRIIRAASSQPARGRRMARTIRRPGCACNSTSSVNCACSRSARGTRKSCELPIRIIRVLVAM